MTLAVRLLGRARRQCHGVWWGAGSASRRSSWIFLASLAAHGTGGSVAERAGRRAGVYGLIQAWARRQGGLSVKRMCALVSTRAVGLSGIPCAGHGLIMRFRRAGSDRRTGSRAAPWPLPVCGATCQPLRGHSGRPLDRPAEERTLHSPSSHSRPTRRLEMPVTPIDASAIAPCPKDVELRSTTPGREPERSEGGPGNGMVHPCAAGCTVPGGQTHKRRGRPR